MGNHHGHEKSDNLSGTSTPRFSGSRRGTDASSGAVPSGDEGQQERPAPPVTMVPVEKLGKLLIQRAQKEEGVNGITETSFTKYIFPQYPELANRLFRAISEASKGKGPAISSSHFKTQCDKLLSMLDDHSIIDTYVKMFSGCLDENVILPEGLRSLLYTSYKLSMDHYPEGPQTCLLINKTLAAVVNGCFNNKESHSVGFVVRWVEEHCHRIVFPIHRYVVHVLSTRARELSSSDTLEGPGAPMELSTPVLERGTWSHGALLTGSAAWLLAAAAPPLYSRPTQPPQLPGGCSLMSRAWLSRLVCAVPSHWVPLYTSLDHGLGSNRFLHHVLSYRGPSVLLIQAAVPSDLVLVVAVPQEWKDTHHYWGNQDSALFQMHPTFCLVERAPKMLYLNSCIRGYPKGLRVGSDTKKPLVNIHEGFDNFSYKDTPYKLECIEVWGCGDTSTRDAQLEIKNWQVREAERQRTVKLSATDWLDHPDRYLLEMAGRVQYNNTGS